MHVAVTLRVSEEAHRTLKEIAGDRGVPMTELLDELLREVRKKQIIREINEDYARLRQDPKAWAQLLEERREWDCTLLDGLEDDPWVE